MTSRSLFSTRNLVPLFISSDETISYCKRGLVRILRSVNAAKSIDNNYAILNTEWKSFVRYETEAVCSVGKWLFVRAGWKDVTFRLAGAFG